MFKRNQYIHQYGGKRCSIIHRSVFSQLAQHVEFVVAQSPNGSWFERLEFDAVDNNIYGTMELLSHIPGLYSIPDSIK